MPSGTMLVQRDGIDDNDCSYVAAAHS